MSFPGKIPAIIYCRYSKEEQRQQSIYAQRQFCERKLNEYGIEAEIIVIVDEGVSGELLNRPGIDRVRQLIESGECGLLIAEDSSRLFRDIGYCLGLVGTAVDLKVRVICPNDDVDTSRKDWRKRLIAAQNHHTEVNEYTRNRISRTISELWSSGSAVGLLRPGYVRKHRDGQTRRSTKVDEINPDWLPVIQSAYEMVAGGTPLSTVATFLTLQGLPKCANSRSSDWSEKNVIDLIRRTIYRGVEQYGKKTSEKQYRTGNMKSVPNPDPSAVLSRDMPHLRMVEDWLWYKANQAIDDRARPGESLSGSDHPLHGIPRESRSPLSNLFFCIICDGKMHMTGRNEGGYRCSTASHNSCRTVTSGGCWNKATALRELTHQRIGAAVSQAILEISEAVATELLKFMQERLGDRTDLAQRQAGIQRRQSELKREQDRLVRAITQQDDPPEFLGQKLEALRAEAMQLDFDNRLLEEQCSAHVDVPSRDELLRELHTVANQLTLNDREAGSLLKRLIDGKIWAVPCQQFGSSNVVLRAEFTLQLAQLAPANVRSFLLTGESSCAESPEVLRRKIVVNLFEPSQIPQNAMRALELYQQDPDNPPTLDQLATQLGISKHAAHQALQMGKQLQAAGRTDPYEPLTECPENTGRWKFKDAS